MFFRQGIVFVTFMVVFYRSLSVDTDWSRKRKEGGRSKIKFKGWAPRGHKWVGARLRALSVVVLWSFITSTITQLTRGGAVAVFTVPCKSATPFGLLLDKKVLENGVKTHATFVEKKKNLKETRIDVALLPGSKTPLLNRIFFGFCCLDSLVR